MAFTVLDNGVPHKREFDDLLDAETQPPLTAAAYDAEGAWWEAQEELIANPNRNFGNIANS